MSDLIYKRYLSHEWTTAWQQLPQVDKEAWLAKLDEALRKVGGMRFVLVACDSSQALQQWDTFGVEVFPDKAALTLYRQHLDELHPSQYVETETGIGTDFGALGLRECVLGGQ